jgi:parallel beta-helix repeat protein
MSGASGPIKEESMRTQLRDRGVTGSGIGAALALGLALLGSAAPVGAVDGVIEINQAKVMASGGFPFVISQPGSYRLTGDITVDENTTAIRITASNVTVDLNGFAIIGPTVCSGVPPITPFECAPTGTGGGVVSDGGDNATVLNGTVRGMGGAGVSVGGQSRVEGVHAISNGGGGIGASFSSLIAGNVVNSNGASGISLGSGCTVTGNTVNNNGGIGISAQAGSTLIGNTVRGNIGLGLSLSGIGGASGYTSNVLNGNNVGGAQVSGGVQMGGNVCAGVACP